MTFPTRQPAGFTLIEMLLYLALFSIIIGGGLVAAYSVIEASGRSEERAILQVEGNFLLSKINWALSGATAINDPTTILVSGSRLSVNKLDDAGTATIPMSFGLDASNNMTLQMNGGAPLVLNNSNVSILPGTLIFTHTLLAGDGVNPEKLEAHFTLRGTDEHGQQVTQDFSATNYLRK